MMKKFLLAVSVCLLVFSAGLVMAQSDYEAIDSFDSAIVVQSDNSIIVTETIAYHTGYQERHGILRNIDNLSSQGRRMKIEVLAVTNDRGEENQPFTTTSGSNFFEIKIGDPDLTFSGQRTYIIKYRATRAVGQLDDFDEIYWNVTGNDWYIPINEVKVSIVLPNDAEMTKSACYFGGQGSKNQCSGAQVIGDKYFFTPIYNLDYGEGLTVALGFPKGFVTAYTSKDDLSMLWRRFGAGVLGLLIFLLTFFFSFRKWYRTGRDPKGTGVIVPQYDVPDNLTPIEVAGLVKRKIGGKELSAEIIYLATKGYLKIESIDKQILGIDLSPDYKLIKLKDDSDLDNEFDKLLLKYLFGNNETVTMSTLRYKFHAHLRTIADKAWDTLLKKNYYKNLGKVKSDYWGILFVSFFLAFWMSGFFGIFFFVLTGVSPSPLVLGIVLSIAVYFVFYLFHSAQTKKGVQTTEYLLGLKNYLQISEKDRLNFHNPPEKKPELFEHLLPYAMIFGVEKAWAKEFTDIYVNPPDWYSASGHSFNSVVFNSFLSGFQSSTNSSLGSSRSSGTSGSGGGGSSGGGGGGGGGGSW